MVTRSQLLPISQPPPLVRREALPELVGGDGYRLELPSTSQRPLPTLLGWYRPDLARLVVPIDADGRGVTRAGGVVLHSQLLGWADRDHREQYGGLRGVATLVTRGGRAVALSAPVPWPIVRAFAAAGLLQRDERYRRGGHALVPWAVWEGTLTEVPPGGGEQLGLLP